jgi:hypothetical protein
MTLAGTVDRMFIEGGWVPASEGEATTIVNR